jgi:hypothetical protein
VAVAEIQAAGTVVLGVAAIMALSQELQIQAVAAVEHTSQLHQDFQEALVVQVACG